MEEIIIAAMDAMGGYETELASNISSTISGDMTIADGVTMVVSTYCTISGEVTISGSGTIKRMNANGYITVSTGATLTLDGVTVDGDNLGGFYGMIRVEGGTLIIKNSTIKTAKQPPLKAVRSALKTAAL